MTTRIKNLSENEMVKRLTDLRAKLDSLKNSQRAGSQNVVIKRIATGNNIDFTMNVSYHTISIWEVTITPSDSTFANTTFIWRIFWNAITVSGSGTVEIIEDVLPPSGGTRKARIYAVGTTNPTTATFGMRTVVYAIGNATLSIVQIA